MPLHGEDLLALAQHARLTVQATDADSLERLATQIHTDLHSWVVWSRVDDRITLRGEALAWLSDLECWITDGITVLGGSHSEHSPAWGPDRDGMSGALALLMRGWPVVTHHTAGTPDGDAAFGRWLAIASLMRDARAIPSLPADPRVDFDALSTEQLRERISQPNIYEATKHLLSGMLSGIGALRLLAEGVREYAGTGLQIRLGPDESRRILMRSLAYRYEELHGKPFTVVVPNPRTHGSLPPRGPALDWTRGLFRLMKSRVEAMSAEIVDKHAEFAELAAWGDRPHAAAELIRPVKQWERERKGRSAEPG